MKSPIEEKFMGAFMALVRAMKDERLFFELQVAEQEPVGNGFVDFAFKYLGVNLAVECDGHEFHEKTKQQASRDRARDREIQQQGFAVFRFTGHDLYWNAEACAQECIDYLISKGGELEGSSQRLWCLAYDHGWLHGREKKDQDVAEYTEERKARSRQTREQ